MRKSDALPILACVAAASLVLAACGTADSPAAFSRPAGQTSAYQPPPPPGFQPPGDFDQTSPQEDEGQALTPDIPVPSIGTTSDATSRISVSSSGEVIAGGPPADRKAAHADLLLPIASPAYWDSGDGAGTYKAIATIAKISPYKTQFRIFDTVAKCAVKSNAFAFRGYGLKSKQVPTPIYRYDGVAGVMVISTNPDILNAIDTCISPSPQGAEGGGPTLRPCLRVYQLSAQPEDRVENYIALVIGSKPDLCQQFSQAWPNNNARLIASA